MLIVLSVSFGIRLFFSCNTPDPIDFHYNQLSVTGIDNSGQYINKYDTVNTMYSEAIALQLSLTDTSMYYTASLYHSVIEALALPSVHAFSPVESFTPFHKVTAIQITTVLDLNETLKSGDNVTEHFLYAEDSFDLYHSLEKGISFLNGTQAYPTSSITVILKPQIENTLAQFEVSITLDNGHTLFYTTETFSIIK
ncbi:hypothetical protein GCM10023331_10550 [Algivirga pacifica]|uniref:DUF5034 domain-containing protein n=2 Tax=Algivirga pacifica TaxID=1162670 RepID=A0ABP9D742_9BACT